MHFNDSEMKVRRPQSPFLHSSSEAHRWPSGGTRVELIWVKPPLATVTLLLGLVLWGAYYFVDQGWYHRLLIGSVVHGDA